jgi:methylmalonyl-CoA/ethylmalonyl-CoA epimerase
VKLHHLGWVGRNLERMRKAFEREGAQVISPPIDDPVQRVTVQFLREPATGELWELVVPLGDVADSPLTSRLGRGGGFDHVCYELDQGDGTLEQRLATEVKGGGQVVCPPVMAAAFERRVAFVFRRSQRLIEFVEPRQPGQSL